MVATVTTIGRARILTASVAGGWVWTAQTGDNRGIYAASCWVPDAGHASSLSSLTVPSNTFTNNQSTVLVFNVNGGWIVLYQFATAQGIAVSAVSVADAGHAISPADFASSDYH